MIHMTTDELRLTSLPHPASKISSHWKLPARKVPAAGWNLSSRWKFAARGFPVLGIFIAALLYGSAELSSARAAVVREIAFEQLGDVPVETNSVLAFTSVRVGQDITRTEVSRDVESLRKSGRFTFVAAQIADATAGAGVKVIYQLNPKPRIERIEVTGAEELGNSKVRELLGLGAGDLVDEDVLAFRRIKVQEEYEKKLFPEAKLTFQIVTDQQTGLCVVKVQVEEGEPAHVRNITFPGAQALKESKLRGAMQQKEHWFFSWLTGSGTYKPSELEADCETLRRIYQDLGFLDAKVGPYKIAATGKGFMDIEIPVVEGTKYRFGKVTVTGVTGSIYSEQQIGALVTNRSGDLAAMSAIEGAARNVRMKYTGNGYIATRVAPQFVPRAGTDIVDVELKVTEGHKASIRDIHIRGNRATQDRVIRREITVLPGDEYSEAKVRTSENRLRGLGYFDFVASSPQETADPAKYDLTFEVEEKRTGNMILGAGFSSIDNVVGFFELSQGNFNLFDWPPTGAGQKLKLSGTIGSRRTDAEVSFVEPWFLDRPLALGVDLFRRDERYSSDYNLLNTGGALSLGKRLTGYSRLNVMYGLQEYDVYDVEEDASDTIKEEEGARLKSAVTLELVRDSRDNPFIPTRGSRASAAVQLAGGPLGAETDLYKFTLSATKYFPIWFDHVFSVRGTWASVDHYGDSDRVPIFDRLFLGGARTVRGFDYRDVGPKDENEEPVGGLTSEFLSLEYTIPVVEKVRFALFYDVGMVYEDAFEFSSSDMNSDWGFGLRFDVPGFPIRLDYAFPLETDEFNDGGGRFQFSIGYGQ